MIERFSKRFFDTWASYGYTSVNDLSGFSGGRMLKPDMLKKMEAEGNLSVRGIYLYTLFSLDEIDEALKYLGNDTPMVRFIGLKIFVMGCMQKVRHGPAGRIKREHMGFLMYTGMIPWVRHIISPE